MTSIENLPRQFERRLEIRLHCDRSGGIHQVLHQAEILDHGKQPAGVSGADAEGRGLWNGTGHDVVK